MVQLAAQANRNKTLIGNEPTEWITGAGIRSRLSHGRRARQQRETLEIRQQKGKNNIRFTKEGRRGEVVGRVRGMECYIGTGKA